MKKTVVLVWSLMISLQLSAFEFVYARVHAENLNELQVREDSLRERLFDSVFANKGTERGSAKKPARFCPYIAPAALISYGMMSLENHAIIRVDHHLNHEMMEGKEHFSASVEDKLQYVPVAAVYALNAIGLKGRNGFVDRTVLYLTANSLTGMVVSLGKDKLQKFRPNGDLRSFPSGHTATAFAAAEFMHQEFKDKSAWLGYAGYSVATLTGVLRMTHNKHWLSDVIGGAGVGILSTKVSYIAYPWLKDKLFHKHSKKHSPHYSF